MKQKKTTQEEYQKCVNKVVDYINLHLGEEIDLKSLAGISNFSPFYFHRIMKHFWVNLSERLLSGRGLKQLHVCCATPTFR
ncbi:transcriptional regulator [Bacteroides reticulotermitis JCM 10512]|uniref:Transcriptional regulator n=1 Tax=Bacteroides reticulotermitis JCM 10512 TaxID=1445607 RepID=W4UWI7_9BACE|nr:transcriptional regulator [Bacteroides reticulotermitis JCM 10512]